MLTCGTLNARAPHGKAGFLRLIIGYSVLLAIFFNIAVSGFIRNRTYCARFKNMVFTEKFFCIAMSIKLIFAGKVKVYIRRFVPVEAKESFKRNVVSVALHLCSTVWANLWRKVKSRTD